jgi:hypothetical protein
MRFIFYSKARATQIAKKALLRLVSGAKDRLHVGRAQNQEDNVGVETNDQGGEALHAST